jgi:hypothetical protein
MIFDPLSRRLCLIEFCSHLTDDFRALLTTPRVVWWQHLDFFPPAIADLVVVLVGRGGTLILFPQLTPSIVIS